MGVLVNGASHTNISNCGSIHQAVELGSGDAIVKYNPGSINGSVDQGSGDDLSRMEGGRAPMIHGRAGRQ
ncbi:hypothetical protein N2599_28935 (plasmid) [Rhizobium sullae]|uniref:Uncharacterized protein n=1 Tax=Rhizobium sullae TaxID=50338 RepID=A0A2N0CYA6_RHISU|nr:hypothetical protein [Rhizobium sullae]PKA38844.1 hypothetical protein CWR43_35930 [Rhizobium sullae]UWU16853.1 hypothetical protein N2599_28935 [Rhizobium sullae]